MAVRSLALGLLFAAVGCTETVPTPGDALPIPAGPGSIEIDSGPSRLTNETPAVFTFHADRATTFTCEIDGVVSPCTSPATFHVVDGMHVFGVAVGNHQFVSEDFATRHWTVDATPPQTTIDFGPPPVDNSATERITFLASEPATFECSLDGAAFAACTSPVMLTPGDGVHTFAARATDSFGNVDPTAATRSWTLDTAVIDTMITSGPVENGVTKASVTFGFAASLTPATFVCSFDSESSAPCTSPITRVLAAGPHSFHVAAKDNLGQMDPSPVIRKFKVDDTVPVVTINLHPSNPSNATTPVFGFSVSEGSVFQECQVDAGPFIDCISQYTTPVLGAGPHRFGVRATDLAGNVSDVATYDWTIDLDAPTVTITSGPTGRISNRTPTFEFTVTGPTTGVTCQIDFGAAAPCTSPVTTPSLSDATHRFSVFASTAVGNVGTDSRVFTVDTTGPTVTFDSKPPSDWTVPYFDFTFHASEAGATLECALDTGAFSACTSPLTTTVPAVGAHQLVVRAVDNLGNVGAGTTASWNYVVGGLMFVQFDGNSPESGSVLAQVPGYVPPASVATITGVGGRAGIAARSPSYHYVGTKRAFSTSPGHKMSAVLWIRPRANASGVIWSNATASDGITLSWTTTGVRLSLLHAGSEEHLDVAAPVDEWHLVSVSSQTQGDGAELWFDGSSRGVVGAGSGTTGFDDNQADDLTIGPMTNIDLDDLVIFSRPMQLGFLCALGGGTSAQSCSNILRPAYELAFEGDFANTGTFHLPVSIPESSSFIAGHLGSALRLSAAATDFSMSGFGAAAVGMTERTFTFSTDLTFASDDVLLDFMSSTAPSSGGRVTYLRAQTQLKFVFTTTTGDTETATIPTTAGRHSIAIVERLAGGSTASVNIYVDTVTPKATLSFASGTLITAANDRIGFISNASSVIDEVRLWPRDLAASDSLCRLGFGGQGATVCTLP